MAATAKANEAKARDGNGDGSGSGSGSSEYGSEYESEYESEEDAKGKKKGNGDDDAPWYLRLGDGGHGHNDLLFGAARLDRLLLLRGDGAYGSRVLRGGRRF